MNCLSQGPSTCAQLYTRTLTMEKTTTVQVGDKGCLLDDMPGFGFAGHVLAFDASEDFGCYWPRGKLLDRVAPRVRSFFNSQMLGFSKKSADLVHGEDGCMSSGGWCLYRFTSSSTTVSPQPVVGLIFQALCLLFDVAHPEMRLELAFIHCVSGVQGAGQAALTAPLFLSLAPRGDGAIVVVARGEVLMVPTPDGVVQSGHGAIARFPLEEEGAAVGLGGIERDGAKSVVGGRGGRGRGASGGQGRGG